MLLLGVNVAHQNKYRRLSGFLHYLVRNHGAAGDPKQISPNEGCQVRDQQALCSRLRHHNSQLLPQNGWYSSCLYSPVTLPLHLPASAATFVAVTETETSVYFCGCYSVLEVDEVDETQETPEKKSHGSVLSSVTL